MILSVLSASDPSSDPTTFKDAQEQATNAASWVEQNWSTWLGIGLRILLIVVVAVVLRVAIRRAITKLIERMNRTAQAVDGTALGGCWSMWSAADSARRRSAACCARSPPS